MLSSTKRTKVTHKKGDIVIDAVTRIKRGYDGTKWRRLCSVRMCDRMTQLQGLCMRHFRELEIQQQLAQNNESPKQLPIGDFFMVACDQNDSINTSKKDFYQNDFHNDSKFFLFFQL